MAVPNAPDKFSKCDGRSVTHHKHSMISSGSNNSIVPIYNTVQFTLLCSTFITNVKTKVS